MLQEEEEEIKLEINVLKKVLYILLFFNFMNILEIDMKLHIMS